MKRTLLAITLSALAASAAIAQSTIKIGEINSYKAQPAFLEPYKKGWELAQDEINKAGGVNGKKLRLCSVTTTPTPATPCAWQRSWSRARRWPCCRAPSSNIGLAVGDFAKQRKCVRRQRAAVGQSDLGKRQRLHVPPARFHLHADDHAGARSRQTEQKRWGIVYPNYEYGQSAANSFKKLLIAAQPAGGVEFVEQAAPLGKIDAAR